jgi:homoserine O-acetyltransferase
MTRKLDSHDVSHPSIFNSPPTLSSRLPQVDDSSEADLDLAPLHHALSLLPPALVIGVESDGLFTTTEQKELAAHIPGSELVLIPSPDGHDGFLLEFEAINEWVDGWFRRKLPEFYDSRVISLEDYHTAKGAQADGAKDSVFGEVEADVTRW